MLRDYQMRDRRHTKESENICAGQKLSAALARQEPRQD
jgi:hypothetical protein